MNLQTRMVICFMVAGLCFSGLLVGVATIIAGAGDPLLQGLLMGVNGFLVYINYQRGRMLLKEIIQPEKGVSAEVERSP